MTTAVRRNLWPQPGLGRLLAGTAIVLGATAFWLISLHGDDEYAALASGAWTTLTLFWGLFAVQRLRRRQAA
jgi:thiol:disulfide interchange protein